MAVAAFLALTLSGKAQDSRPQPVSSLRLYVLDLGARPGRNATQPPTVSPAYLIVHPKGTLMWEAGALKDDFITDPKKSRANLRDNIREWVSERTLKDRLADIGYKESDITFFAMSHFHDDHGANANDFAAATWLVQRDERAVMFGDKLMTPPYDQTQEVSDFRRYNHLKNAKTIVIEQKDHDVFGDGSVVIKLVPANTPGGQALVVKLAKTGPIVLSGDLYHRYDQHAPPYTDMVGSNGPEDNKRSVASRMLLEEFMKQTGTKLWIQHDYPFYMTLKKAPEYYE